jgi:hypothetical protein
VGGAESCKLAADDESGAGVGSFIGRESSCVARCIIGYSAAGWLCEPGGNGCVGKWLSEGFGRVSGGSRVAFEWLSMGLDGLANGAISCVLLELGGIVAGKKMFR